MTVSEMLSRISSHELAEWMAFYELEPWGVETEMLGHAITSTVIANVNRNPQKRPAPYKTSDFMPEFDSQTAKENQVLKVRQINAMFGGEEQSE